MLKAPKLQKKSRGIVKSLALNVPKTRCICKNTQQWCIGAPICRICPHTVLYVTSPTKDRIRIGRLFFVQNQKHFLHVCNLFPLLRATFCKIRGRPGKFDCFVLQNPTKDSQPCSHFCDTVTSTRLSIFKDVKKVLFCWSSWKALRRFYLKLDFSLLQLICQSSKLGR